MRGVRIMAKAGCGLDHAMFEQREYLIFQISNCKDKVIDKPTLCIKNIEKLFFEPWVNHGCNKTPRQEAKLTMDE